MKRFGTLFLILAASLALFVTITGLTTKTDLPSRMLQILFLPVPIYLSYLVIGRLQGNENPVDSTSLWQRFTIYYCFILTTIFVATSFVSANTIPNFFSSLIFSPLAIYFLFLVWPKYKFSYAKVNRGTENEAELKSDNGSFIKVDVDKRDFLKLVGSAGVLALILGVFNKRSSIAPFFGNLGDGGGAVTIKDQSGNDITPAQNSPTDGYNITQIDDATSTSYFGFINKNGQWFIMKEADDNSYRYVKGDNDFSGNWERRKNLTYDYFDKVF